MQNKNLKFKIIELPPKRWKEFRDLKLEAVSNDTVAFGQMPSDVLKNKSKVWQDKLKNSIKNEYNFLVFIENNGKLIGMIGADQVEREKIMHNAQINGVYINKSFRGFGMSSKLFEALLIKIKKNKIISRLDLEVTSSQKNAVHLYKSLGFKKNGIMHKALKDSGKYYDLILMEKFIK